MCNWKEYWIMFSDNWGYYSLKQSSNLTSAYFLKGYLQYRQWNPINELFLFCYIKYISQSYSLKSLTCMVLQHHALVIWKLLVPLNYAELPKSDTYYYATFKKLHPLTSPISSEMSLRIGKLLSSWWHIHIFQNSNFLLEDKLYDPQYCQLLSVKL